MVTRAAEIIPELVERVVRRFDPERVILFGSHARGDARPGSDVDLLVVLRDVPDKHAATVEVMRLFRDLAVPVDVIVTTPEEIAQRGDSAGSVLRPALREGRVVYAR